MRSVDGRGRTLDEAVDAALIELGETRRNVDVKVVRETPDETVVEVTGMGPLDFKYVDSKDDPSKTAKTN